MTKWNFDPSHSEVTFKVKHMMIANVTGTISKVYVDATSEDDQFSNPKISFSADMKSITTGDEKRDGHLQSADFFDTEKFGEMNFVSQSYSNGKLIGDLTIKDVTKSIELNVEEGGSGKDPWGNFRLGFTVSGKFNRKDYGLEWNAVLETGGLLVSDEVKINGEIQLVKAA